VIDTHLNDSILEIALSRALWAVAFIAEMSLSEQRMWDIIFTLKIKLGAFFTAGFRPFFDFPSPPALKNPLPRIQVCFPSSLHYPLVEFFDSTVNSSHEREKSTNGYG
jgi:hypothetical protein